MTISAFVRDRVFGDGDGRRKARDRKPVASEVERERPVSYAAF